MHEWRALDVRGVEVDGVCMSGVHLMCASHQLALITSLPFVHTARRSYRLSVLVKCSDWFQRMATSVVAEKIIKPSHLEEGEVVTRFP